MILIIEEMKERDPCVLDFLATVYVPVDKDEEDQFPPVCLAYGVVDSHLALGHDRYPWNWSP